MVVEELDDQRRPFLGMRERLQGFEVCVAKREIREDALVGVDRGRANAPLDSLQPKPKIIRIPIVKVTAGKKK